MDLAFLLRSPRDAVVDAEEALHALALLLALLLALSDQSLQPVSLGALLLDDVRLLWASFCNETWPGLCNCPTGCTSYLPPKMALAEDPTVEDSQQGLGG